MRKFDLLWKRHKKYTSPPTQNKSKQTTVINGQIINENDKVPIDELGFL